LGANFTRNYTESYSNLVESLHNKTLIITTIMTEPYTMLKENSEVLTGNDRFGVISSTNYEQFLRTDPKSTKN